jgi:hypothetical protein
MTWSQARAPGKWCAASRGVLDTHVFMQDMRMWVLSWISTPVLHHSSSSHMLGCLHDTLHQAPRRLLDAVQASLTPALTWSGQM